MHCCTSYGTNQAQKRQASCDYPTPYSLEETLEKLRHRLAAACNENALTLLEKAVTKARDDEAYAKRLEETLLQGSTIEIRECLSCFGDYVERLDRKSVV